MSVVLGNIFSLIGGVCLIISTFSKDKSKLIVLQILDSVCATISNIFLQAYSGIVMSLCSITRNILNLKFELSKVASTCIVVCIGIVACIVNNLSLIGICPIIATVSYSCAMCYSKDLGIILGVLALNNLLYLIYGFATQNYTACIFRVFVIVISIYNMIKQFKQGEKNEKRKEEQN